MINDRKVPSCKFVDHHTTISQVVSRNSISQVQTIVNRRDGLEAGGEAKSCYCSLSRDNTGASKTDSVIRDAYRSEAYCALKSIFFRKKFVCQELIARFTVVEPVENTQGLVFLEFQLKTTIYQRKLAKRGCAL